MEKETNFDIKALKQRALVLDERIHRALGGEKLTSVQLKSVKEDFEEYNRVLALIKNYESDFNNKLMNSIRNDNKSK